MMGGGGGGGGNEWCSDQGHLRLEGGLTAEEVWDECVHRQSIDPSPDACSFPLFGERLVFCVIFLGNRSEVQSGMDVICNWGLWVEGLASFSSYLSKEESLRTLKLSTPSTFKLVPPIGSQNGFT